MESPLGIAMEYGAKILHFGSSPASTTFLHLIEDVCAVPFLGDAVCCEKTPDGKIRKYVLRKHLPGDREFYCEDNVLNSKIFKKLRSHGLEIRKQP